MNIKQILAYYKTQPLHVRLRVMIRMCIVDFNKIINYFKNSNEPIMELGCGYGIVSFMLADKFRESSIRSYEINPGIVKILNAINPFEYLSFEQKNILDIRKFDSKTIFMSDLLHHIEYQQQENLLKKIYDTGPNDLILIIKDMDRGRKSFGQFCNYMIDIFCGKEHLFYYRTKDSFINLFTQCGFKIKKMNYINRFFIPLNHILFILEKGY